MNEKIILSMMKFIFLLVITKKLKFEYQGKLPQCMMLVDDV